jgi:predicted nucleotidyltransferase
VVDKKDDSLIKKASSDIRDATERIVEAFDSVRVTLFGSYARDEGQAESDLDRLVVLLRVNYKREAVGPCAGSCVTCRRQKTWS